jgi:hypothetical protein
MINALRSAYRYERQLGRSPSVALARARATIAAGKRSYTNTPSLLPLPGTALAIQRLADDTSRRGTAWIDGMPDCRADYADKLAKIGHTGWFTDDSKDETFRGVVIRLPNRRGFLIGYQENLNDCVTLERVTQSACDGARDAALMADCITRIAAEKEQIYQEEQRLIDESGDISDSND